MIITTTNSIPQIQWKDVEILGLVSGSAVQPKYEVKKPTTKSGIYDYIDDVVETRRIAVERMTDEAKKLGAEAIVKVEYITTPLLQGYIEIMIYGTAVRFNEAEITETAEERHLTYELPEFISKPTKVDIFPEQNHSDKNILNINATHEEILQKSVENTDVKNLLEKIYDKTKDVSYELCRVYSKKENIDYIFDEIAELTFGRTHHNLLFHPQDDRGRDGSSEMEWAYHRSVHLHCSGNARFRAYYHAHGLLQIIKIT